MFQGRTAELESEILKLKAELKRYQDPNRIAQLDDELEVSAFLLFHCTLSFE